ncbi:MAG: electron transfer flavoprotein subunit alpha/FixB family protein [Hyphomicrobium sp.]|uniref:electron transfer flavoprotein subunit alpha/FixB family protein n=1 Tax=Hyphomicrobium sp. TaxID=82 RepID=UPI0039E68344
MNAKRVDPRRPYRVGPNGLRRIVLGEIGIADISAGPGSLGAMARAKPLRTNVQPTGWYMAVAHAYRGRLDDHAREAIAAAAILAGPETGVIAVIFGAFHEDAAVAGADKVVVVDAVDAARFDPEREEFVIEALLEEFKPEHVFMPDNLLGDGDLGRRLIARQRASAATHVVELDGKHVAVGWSGGARMADQPLPRFVLLQPGAVDSSLPFLGAGEMLRAPEPDISTKRYRDLGLEPTESGAIALEEADFIVSAGNGVKNVATLEALAQSLGATVGASRVAVDDGKLPRSKQIGASGKTVSATTYFAIGISGAVQHLQGIKACRHVIAINRDAGAPIAKRADLTVIADAEDLMQALIARVAQARLQSEPETKA